MLDGWRLEGDYYEHVETGYDLLAPSYDEDIGTNRIGSRMRLVFRKALMRVFRPGQRLFEIGCGTGLDALWLARQGLEVVATDISDRMVAGVRERADRDGLADRVTCKKLAARDIGALANTFGEQSFDGGYCHAGALNMEPDLPRASDGIRAVLHPSGHFVCSIVNQTSLFEVIFYLAVLRPRKAFRRLGNTVPIPISRMAPLNRFVVPARFYSPKEVTRIFGENFRLARVQGMQIVLPPSNLAMYYEAMLPLFRPLDTLETRLGGVWPFNEWGHHTILDFVRR
jgi:ubiquinone/menaquinone biosynthesis C-methylase UbiE